MSKYKTSKFVQQFGIIFHLFRNRWLKGMFLLFLFPLKMRNKEIIILLKLKIFCCWLKIAYEYIELKLNVNHRQELIHRFNIGKVDNFLSVLYLINFVYPIKGYFVINSKSIIIIQRQQLFSRMTS